VGQVAQVERLPDHALARERCVAVQQDRHHPRPVSVPLRTSTREREYQRLATLPMMLTWASWNNTVRMQRSSYCE
jgi:hypothetical protein